MKFNIKSAIFTLVLFLLAGVYMSTSLTKQRVAEGELAQYKEDNAVLIVMAYPDLVVKTTESPYHEALTYIGVGDGERTRAGHACMVLVKDGSETFEYFDNGRYIAPEGYSRVRSADTDIETTVDVKARWENGKLANLEELLQWLYDHPEKTHGANDLYASINDNVSYERVKGYVEQMQEIDIINYGPFESEGSNCSRFVTDAMSVGILGVGAQRKIKPLYRITPSVLGNVKAASSNGKYYRVTADSLFITKENLISTQRDMLFDWGRDYPEYTPVGSLVEPLGVKADDSWKWLSGIGYGVWYDIEPMENPRHFTITQYSYKGEVVFSDVFASDKHFEFDADNFEVTYPSHYRHVTIVQGGEEIVLRRVS